MNNTILIWIAFISIVLNFTLIWLNKKIGDIADDAIALNEKILSRWKSSLDELENGLDKILKEKEMKKEHDIVTEAKRLTVNSD